MKSKIRGCDWVPGRSLDLELVVVLLRESLAAREVQWLEDGANRTARWKQGLILSPGAASGNRAVNGETVKPMEFKWGLGIGLTIEGVVDTMWMQAIDGTIRVSLLFPAFPFTVSLFIYFLFILAIGRSCSLSTIVKESRWLQGRLWNLVVA